MLKVSNISKSYDQKNFAIKDLSFELKKGTIMALIGHNGAGKSTTLRMISGIIGLNEGKIEIDNYDISKASSRELKKLKRKIGFISESIDLLEYLTAWEYLFYIGKLYGIEDDTVLNNKISNLIEVFNIVDANSKAIEAYSSGLKKRIALSSLMINDPNLLLLDEPTADLDPIGVKILKKYLKDQREKGTAIILATHQLDIAETLADQVLMINEGEMIFEGSLDMLKNKFKESSKEDNLETYYSKLINS